MTFSEDVQKGLIAGAFGLVGTLVPAVISWSHDRSADSARTRTLERSKSTEFQNKVDDLSVWRRLLLLYAPARSAAWLPRLFFYVGLACALIIPLGLAAPQDPLTPKDLLVSELFFLVWIESFAPYPIASNNRATRLLIAKSKSAHLRNRFEQDLPPNRAAHLSRTIRSLRNE
ncbi:MAG TPA: hypothetical protein VNY74_13810 [Edaphobacter sp.]|nr:hypothetical protein [Edaphobacter sp.]